MKAWHFTDTTLRGGQPLPKRGDTLAHDGPIAICKSGYHGSARAIDALKYAPGTMVALVEIVGDIEQQSDKLVGQRRTTLTDYRDSREILTKLARIWALRALRVHAAGALRAAGLTEHADKLAALTDDCKLVAAGKSAGTAADAAWGAAVAAGLVDAARVAEAAVWVAEVAAVAAGLVDAARVAEVVVWAARDAERDQQNTELEAQLKKLLA